MSKSIVGRFLIDYENPDAGIGHSLGHVNNAYKTCLRNGLTFAFTDKQLIKSTETDWKWRLQKAKRLLTGRKPYETHNLGSSIIELFKFDNPEAKSREEVETLINKGRLRVIELPRPKIEIPSNWQDDNASYKEIDQVINANPENGTVFVLPNKRTGDFEYAASKEWFKYCYSAARAQFPIGLAYQDDSLSIVIHIRRGDLLPGRQFSDLSNRMLPDAWYVEIIQKILKISQQMISLVIVSEGINGHYCSESGKHFSWADKFSSKRVKVIELIDAPFNYSFHQMKNAKILIGSKSGMSHLAGMLNDGIKIMPKMWHSYRGAQSVIEIEDGRLEQALIEIENVVLSNFP